MGLFLAVLVYLVVLAMSEVPFVKGKLADLVIHGAAPIKDIGLVVTGEGAHCFRLIRRVRSVCRPVIAAKFGFLIFLQIVRVVVSGVALQGLLVFQLAAISCKCSILSRMAFFCPSITE